jgi:hypothetical protein
VLSCSKDKRWLHPQTNGDKLIMSYKDRLNRWLVVRYSPIYSGKSSRVAVHASYADGHLQVLKRFMPDAEFTVVFDPDLELDSKE